MAKGPGLMNSYFAKRTQTYMDAKREVWRGALVVIGLLQTSSDIKFHMNTLRVAEFSYLSVPGYVFAVTASLGDIVLAQNNIKI